MLSEVPVCVLIRVPPRPNISQHPFKLHRKRLHDPRPVNNQLLNPDPLLRWPRFIHQRLRNDIPMRLADQEEERQLPLFLAVLLARILLVVVR